MIKNYPLASFFTLAYLISWLLWWGLFTQFGEQSSDFGRIFLIMVGGFGPFLAALIVSYGTKGHSGLSHYLKGLLRWRADGRWYLTAVLTPLFLCLIAYGIQAFMGGQFTNPTAQATPIMFLLIVLLIGGGQEDLAWWGYAYPSLRHKTNALQATLILSILWALWHLPLYVITGTPQSEIAAQSGAVPILAGLLTIIHFIPLTILMSWVFNNGRKVVLLMILFHHTFNALAATWFPVTELFVLVEWSVAIIVILANWSKFLKKRPIPAFQFRE